MTDTEAIQRFFEILQRTLAERTLSGLTLSRLAANRAERPPRARIRPVTLQNDLHYQWSMQFERRETHENLTADEVLARVREQVGTDYRHAHLRTADGDCSLRFSRRGKAKLSRSRVRRDAAADPHDRKKRYLIPEGRPCPFLCEAGVMTGDGKVRAKAVAKFRQINRFLEFVNDVYDQLPAEGTLNVVDFGCGMSYLTFAVHHLLAAIHKRDVRIVGLDRDAHVIERCCETTARLRLEGIEFRLGDIASHQAEDAVHLAISLHACDTATDDALAKAVQWQSAVILAAPCCQHELAAQLNCETLLLLTRHGILKERVSALLTDALRACALEIVGYRTQVIEFIDLEHTPKNVLIRAVRRDHPSGREEEHRRRFSESKDMLGLDRLRIEDVLPLHVATG